MIYWNIQDISLQREKLENLLPELCIARTRGGYLDQGRGSSSQPVDQVHPIASARQSKLKRQVVETHPEDPMPDQARGYSTMEWRGSRNFEGGVNGRKLTAPVDMYIKVIVDNSRLAPLIDCTNSLVDMSLLSTFAERWHRDICSFHLSIGEITITLDDVSSLLHLPIIDHLVSLPAMSKEEANMMLVSLLRVSHRYAWAETEGNLDVVARAYLLHLVGCKNFADNSATLVRVGYLELFRDLAMVGTFAWGAVALAFLYENLKDASFYSTGQITGYMTLLQSLVNLTLVMRRPHSKKWEPLHGTSEVALVRQSLDRLTHADVILTPYLAHRVHCPFHNLSWYRGYNTCGNIINHHLLERVLRQYGHIQSTPPSPHDTLSVSGISHVHYHFLHYEEHLLEDASRKHVMTLLGECVDDYLRWYHRISHPYLRPSLDRVADPRRVPIVGSTSGGASDVISYQGISERLQAMFDRELVTPGIDLGVLAQEALDIANLCVKGHQTRRPSFCHVYRRRKGRQLKRKAESECDLLGANSRRLKSEVGTNRVWKWGPTDLLNNLGNKWGPGE
ncbi:Aminotransferase-like, plant mobile domain [Sesbania bispinosa]|nr:Aminotransferase-like, plant mobile domain [Sesbania bispinosa]